MCEAVGLEVMLLKRVAIGDLSIGHLAPGEYRPLSEKEKEVLLRSVGLEYVRKKGVQRPAKDNKKHYGREKSVHERRVLKRLKNNEYKIKK